MKTYILTAVVGVGGITDGQFVKQDGSGGVIANDGAATGIGFANATKVATKKVGIITNGLVWVPATDAATYNFGDVVELKADGQTVTAGSTNPIGVCVATKTTASGDLSLQVLLDL